MSTAAESALFRGWQINIAVNFVEVWRNRALNGFHRSLTVSTNRESLLDEQTILQLSGAPIGTFPKRCISSSFMFYCKILNA